MRLLILLLIVIGLVILTVQNLEPVTLVFFGSATLSLPIAGWILLFGGGGVLTSLLIQFLNYLQRRSRATPQASAYRSFVEQEPEPYPPTEVRKPPERSPSAPPATKASYSDWENQPTDWEGKNKKDPEEWNIEEPPPQSTVLRDLKRRISEDNPKSKEAPSPAKDSSNQASSHQSSSTYAYGYMGAEDTGMRQSQEEQQTEESDKKRQKPVYDANYRIITPPYRQNSDRPSEPEPEEDEEWI